MVRVLAIVLCGLVSTWSVVGSYPATTAQKQVSQSTDGNSGGHPENDSQPAEGGPFNTAPDGEEESEDKDETSKEKVIQRITTLNLTSFLEELYHRQLLVFDTHQHEVATPPPKS